MCVVLTVIVVLVYTLVALAVRPGLYSDSGWGLLGWEAGRGLPFNYAAYVDPDDISADRIGFPTWWSPGQYFFPGILERAGLDLGLALTIVTCIFSAAGLAGWFVLYRSFGFPAATSAITVALVSLTRHFTLPFGIYNGGEVLLVGVAPWFLVLVWRLRQFGWWTIGPLLVGAAAMVFAKLSGLVISGAAIGAAVLSPAGPWFSRDRLGRALVAFVTLALMGTLFYFLWFSRGETPVSPRSQVAWSAVASYVTYAVSATASAALSLGDLAAYVFLNPAHPVLASGLTIYWLLLPLALATFAFVGWRLHREYADYLRFVLFLGLGVGLVLTAISTRGADIGSDERHLRIVSLLLLAGIVHAVVTARSLWPRGLFVAVVAISSAYGLASAATHAAADRAHPLGVRGFRHLIADAATLDYIHSIDVPAPDRRSTLIYTTSPEIALEVRNVRVMSNHADFETPEELERARFHGRVPHLYVIVQKRLVENGKAEKMLRSFVDYPSDKWRATPVGDFVSFAATP